jgi:hypothetical protein
MLSPPPADRLGLVRSPHARQRDDLRVPEDISACATVLYLSCIFSVGWPETLLVTMSFTSAVRARSW